MKSFLISTGLVIVVVLALAYKFHYPYYYMKTPEYWYVSDMGFQEITKPEDFNLYFIDVLDAKGYDVMAIRQSAIHEAYRNSEKGSYVNTFALLLLSDSSDDKNHQMHLQKQILADHIQFENLCHIEQCGTGDSIAIIAHDYSRNLSGMGDYDNAVAVLIDTYSKRQQDFAPFVRFTFLEELETLFKKKQIRQDELDFFESAVNAVYNPGLSPQLLERHEYLKKAVAEFKQ